MLLTTGSNLKPIVRQVANVLSRYGVNKVQTTKTYVYNAPVSFDTETTSYTTPDDEKVGWLYVWMFTFGDPLSKFHVQIYGRDCDTLSLFLDALAVELGLSADPEKSKLLYVYVHNLGFDIEFIRDRLTIVNQLHAEPHAPIFVRDVRGFEFRDSMILSGGLSLKKIGESLNNGLVKRVGDLDYNMIRTPDTPLTEAELGYCQGDIDVLASYIAQQIEQYKGIQHVPLTNTGRVRKYARDHILKSKGSFGAFTRYRELMDECQLDYDEYIQCQRAFYGGFTHANANHVNRTLYNVASYDFTSSYPAVMLSERFPMGKPEHVERMTLDELREVINDPNRCCVFDLQLADVYVKDNVGDCYLSNDASKVHVLNPVVDNGRVRSCDKIALTCTDVDFKIINQCYDWSRIDVSNILIWRTDWLPTPMISVILDLYRAKTTLKGIPDRQEEYQVKKGMLNSLYGMCVTRILRDKVVIDESGGWVEIELDEEERVKNIDKNNKSKLRFLYYPWGVFITAYARFNLWTAIKTLGNDYIYADTDSIKVFADSPKLTQYLNDYQHDLDLKMGWMVAKRRKFSMDDMSPRTKDGVPKPIGVWDFEGIYDRFKTLGAKRYIKHDEHGVYPTVAGISPKKLAEYLVKKNDGDLDGVFRMFDDGLQVPAENTGKLAHSYCSGVDLTVTDYVGNTTHIHQTYAIHLCPVDFTLTMSGSFLDLIKMLRGQL